MTTKPPTINDCTIPTETSDVFEVGTYWNTFQKGHYDFKPTEAQNINYMKLLERIAGALETIAESLSNR